MDLTNMAARWAAAAVMCMVAGSGALADEPALALSRSDGAITVSVPANTYDDTSKLHLVWGTSDCGEKVSAWPRANHLEYNGAISSAAATYQFSDAGIPAGSIVRAIVTSDVRLIDSWISIGQNQYVNSTSTPASRAIRRMAWTSATAATARTETGHP